MMQDAKQILYVALTVGLIFGILSFFWVPKYEKGAWAIVGVVILIVTNIMTAMFTAHQTAPPPGTIQDTHAETPPVPAKETVDSTKEVG